MMWLYLIGMNTLQQYTKSWLKHQQTPINVLPATSYTKDNPSSNGYALYALKQVKSPD